MRSTKPMYVAKTGYILLSAVFILFGALLMVRPDFSLSVFRVLFGASLLVFGGVKLVGYFSRDLYRLAFQYDLAAGLLLVTLGIVTLAKPLTAISFYATACGIVILTDGLLKLQIALEARRFGICTWWVILALALSAAALGLVMLLRPLEATRAVTMLLGATLLAEGCMNLGVVLCAVKIIRHQLPDTID